ncbi:hypothetical protein [Agromyces sp. PvR057]|uniref:hypothetical protein n=1 Tax=Agromyces sp. PvR057 TaxID=3156403 RepID=UPI000E261B3D
MPTLLPRFQVTETPEIEHALKVAEQAWPELSRAERVLRLFQAGADAIEGERAERRRARRGAVDLSAGSLDIAYEPDYLERLRSEWPE